MQLNAILALVAMASAVSAVSLPVRADSDLELLANGLYETFVDETGNVTTKFTPHAELAVSARDISDASLEARSQLAKRRQGCGAALSTSDSDQANAKLLEQFEGDRVRLSANQKSAYVFNSAVSFICPYSGGWKYKSDIAGNWNWVKTVLCGYGRGGYAQVINGDGDWTAGYTYNGDNYC